jgi:Leucine-rich repeat (LRR) protein
MALIPALMLFTQSAQTQARKADASSGSSAGWTTELFHQAILEKNPQYRGNAQCVIEEGEVNIADLSPADISDFSFLESMEKLQVIDMRGLPVEDLSILKDLPLTILGLEDTNIEDLTPLAGMKLERLYLNNTKVKDIAPLSGMPLEMLNLFGTAVENIEPISAMKKLEYLWLNHTQVSDISSLSKCPLISLTIEGTQVDDLNPLADMKSLVRLHIGDTPVVDLTPLEGLALTRLIFSPGKIKAGIEIVRGMNSIVELGTTFENRRPPQTFWKLYEEGKL